MPRYQIFYDDACPMCRFEMLRLQRLSVAGQFELIDISAADFIAADYGVTQQALETLLHIREQQGTCFGPWQTGIEAIACLYTAIGQGWWTGPLRWRATRGVMARMYRWVAANRYVVSRVLGFQAHQRCSTGYCSNKKLA
ncbi:DUF393 domain-containing protein [Chitinibacter fontanus]|uniref:DUF393 domain-containing protein n=1 Tax=Chitinibacter fontanus TaxID=1737446 RepID=A0A7D5Z695_9NEIS|nr:DUF393 domain-containing protein [Chitinibacter fontanus]QLI81643.1 DUF393 domain-containing protein [Chitinibacter fontanus]